MYKSESDNSMPKWESYDDKEDDNQEGLDGFGLLVSTIV